MKKRVIISSLIVLSLLMLVSIGFASWIISNSHSGASTGNFEAENAVSDGTITVETTADNIIFGKPDTSAQGYTAPQYSWLSYDNSMATQVLVATFDVTLADKESGSPDVVLSLTHAILNSSDDSAYAGTQNYFEFVGFSGSTAGVGSVSGTTLTFTNNGTVTVNVEYRWGSDFGNTNPFLYYNASAYNSTLASTAKTALNALDTLAASIKFKVTVADQAA